MSRPTPSHRLRLALPWVLAAGWWVLALGVMRAGVPATLDDTWEYGVVARTLLEGGGFRTEVIHPPLWGLRDARLTVPVLVHGPLPPLLLVPGLVLLGPSALEHVAWLAALFAVLGAWATGRLAARHFGPAAGLLAAIAFTLAPLTLRAVTHDLTLAIGAFLLALAADLALRERPRALAAGVTLGIAWLARPEMLAAALVLAVLERRLAPALLGGFLLPALPWLVHHALTVGQPLFNLSGYLLVGYWGARPELTVLRDFHLVPARWPGALAEALPALPAKWLDFLPHALKRVLMAPTGATGWIAVIGAMAALERRHRRLGLALLGLALVPLAVMTATLYDERYVAPFLPLACVALAHGMVVLAGVLPPWTRRTRFHVGLLLLLLAPSTLPALREAERLAREDERALAEGRAALAALSVPAAAAPLFSDRPDFTAWTTGRPTVWVTREEWQRLPARPDSSGALPARGDAAATFFLDPPRRR